MGVSPTKTVSIGSKLSLAKLVAKIGSRRRARPVRCGKRLGCAAAGGARRAVNTQRVRKQAFVKKANRIRSLGRLGVDTRRLTASTAAPTMLYGVECSGVADTVLLNMRTSAAGAASAQGGGKNLELVLAAADCDQGTLDPAFAAHTLPIGQWARAVWEK